MRVAIIAPIPHLEVARLSDFHLVLAHLVLENEHYAQFYRERSDDGDYIILDNGAAELGKSVDMDRLLEAADIVGPNEIVIPDVLYNFYATVDNLKTYGPWLRERLPGVKLMAVPQGKTLGEWLWCWDEFCHTPEVDVIGLSKFMCSPKGALRECKGGRGFLTRALDLLLKESPKPHHALGVWGQLSELYELRQRSWVRSVDTSFASICAQQGVEIPIDVWGFTKPVQSLDFHSDAGNRNLHCLNARRFLNFVAGEIGE